MYFGQAQWPPSRPSSVIKTNCSRRNLSVGNVSPILWRWQNLSVDPGSVRKGSIFRNPLLGVRLNPDLHLGQTRKSNLRIASHRDLFAWLDGPWNRERCRKRLQPAFHIVVAVSISVVR